MEALNNKLAELDKKQEELQKKKQELEFEESRMELEREELEEERLKLSQTMTPYEEECLKKELTALGELLELPAVILATLEVMQVAPTENPRDLYNIHIDTGVRFDSGNIGLSVRAIIKTLCPKVESIVRSLFVQEGYVQGHSEFSLRWEKNWDYSTRIRLTTHEALSY
jgi:predicted nuclease with TOPRIM domain